MRLDDFDFELPDEAIALRPARPRDRARLLHVDAHGGLGDRTVADLPGLLRSGDVLVVNDTRVIRAALTGLRAARAVGGGAAPVQIDINLIEREGADRWRALARPAKRLAIGDVVALGEGPLGPVIAQVTEKTEAGGVTLVFNASGSALDAALEAVGAPPLPPYIARRRPVDAADVDDYQTIYAAQAGSVAAPTAGLHITPALLTALAARGVGLERVTLHVGAGTFLPVKSQDLSEHVMHAEERRVSAETAERLNEARAAGGRVVAVGTTALRTLESAVDEEGRIQPVDGPTDIFIQPGHRFAAVDLLMTNFHLPRSTLFMLVCAFCGLEPMRRAYAHAVDSGYRFYSYGDACLLERASS